MTQILAIVFDLDELIGQFVEAGMFWDGLQHYFKNKLTDADFFHMLDMFPQFLRPNIISIFNYLKHQKQAHNNIRVYIFTNNQGPKSWAEKIKNYIEAKIHYNIFDGVIGAYKVRNKIIEPYRTSYDKSYNDFIKCSGLSDNTKVCFLDDQYHPQMKHKNVYYVNVKPYTFNYTFIDMIDTYLQNRHIPPISNKQAFTHYMIDFLKGYSFTYTDKTIGELNIDNIVTKRMMQHIQQFLKPKRTKTHKVKKQPKKKHKTMKNKN